MHRTEEQLLTLLAQVRALSIRLTYGEGSENLPSGVLRVLRVLQSRESKNVPQIARATGTSRQNIQMVVNRLQRSGYIELMTNPSHKRSPRVVLTERGEALIKSYQEAEAGFLARVLAKIRHEDLTTATQVLHQIGLSLLPPADAKDAVSSRRRFSRGTSLESKSSKGLSRPAVSSDEDSQPEEWTFPVNLL